MKQKIIKGYAKLANKMRVQRCKIFGCSMIEEMYAVKRMNGDKPKYNIIKRCYCPKCRSNAHDVIQNNLSRVDMLKNEWFVSKA